MTRYIARRLVWMVLLLLAVSAITFIIFYALPSADPAALRAGRQPNPKLIEQIRHQLGLDRPWYVQYWRYIKRLVLHFDLGYSYQNQVSVKKQIFDRLPATISLTLGAALLWITSGVAIGTISAVKRGKLVDRLTMGGALVAISAPVFWLGLVSLYLFASDIGKLHVFPGAGSYTGLTNDPWKWFTSLILPWLVLAASFTAIYARLLRASLLDTLSEDYIRTAYAKGLPRRTVVVRHGLRSAITPIVTAAGLDIGILLGGAILTERAFNIPGVGRLAYESIRNGDLPTIQGTVLLGAFFIIVFNVVVDVLYAFIDPRIRYA
jgi:peptide/nickel transport system permease protein